MVPKNNRESLGAATIYSYSRFCCSNRWKNRNSITYANHLYLASVKNNKQHTNIQFFTSQMPLLLPNQQHQRTEGRQ